MQVYILHTKYLKYIIFLYIRCGIISHNFTSGYFFTNYACTWKAIRLHYTREITHHIPLFHSVCILVFVSPCSNIL